jgi:putative IMPACT (imprinted ancient) family translation regulator
MNLTNQDMAIVEQALQEAMNNVSDYQAIMAYQNVLNKLKSEGKEQGYTTRNNDSRVLSDDALRYDYDDSSDL